MTYCPNVRWFDLESQCETELHTFVKSFFTLPLLKAPSRQLNTAQEDQMDVLLTLDGGVAALVVGARLGMVVLFIGGPWVRVLDGSSENPQ